MAAITVIPSGRLMTLDLSRRQNAKGGGFPDAIVIRARQRYRTQNDLSVPYGAGYDYSRRNSYGLIDE